MASFAGHRGYGCRRGMCPLLPKAEAFGIFSLTAINFHWFHVFYSIGNSGPSLLKDSDGHAILLFSSHLLFMNVALLYFLGLEGCWSACSFNLRARNMAHSSVLIGLLSCNKVVRYAHAPRCDHTSNVRTLSFNFFACTNNVFDKVSRNRSVVLH